MTPSAFVAHSASQPDAWSARLIEGDANNKTLELRRGADSWMVHLEVRLTRVRVHVNRQICKHKQKGFNDPIRLLFTIDDNSEDPLACEFRYKGGTKIMGLIFSVQGRVLHREGTLTG